MKIPDKQHPEDGEHGQRQDADDGSDDGPGRPRPRPRLASSHPGQGGGQGRHAGAVSLLVVGAQTLAHPALATLLILNSGVT